MKELGGTMKYQVIATWPKTGTERIAWTTPDRQTAEDHAANFNRAMRDMREQTGDESYNTVYSVKEVE